MYVSDHLPVLVQCNLGLVNPKLAKSRAQCNGVVWGVRDSQQVARFHELCNAGLRLIDFPADLSQCSDVHCSSLEHRKFLDEMYHNIVTVLSEAAIKTNSSSGSRKCTRLVGWNRHVRDAYRQARHTHQTWLLFNKPMQGRIYDDMHMSRRIFKSRLSWCQKHQEQIKLDIIASHRSTSNFSQFWKATSKLNPKPGLPASVGNLGDSGSIANMFVEHFSVRPLLGTSANSVDRGPCVNSDLVRFTAKQVAKVVSSMTRGKSPGLDGLSIEHLQHAGVHLPRVLAMFFSLCMGHSYLPHDLMQTVVVPIVKNRTGDVADKNNYRPISLATVLAKVLDGLLDTLLERYLHLHEAQFGFRPGLSTESAILGMKHTVQYYTQRRTPVYACFLDLSRAFDTVSYGVLWAKLRERGVPAELLRIFQYWYGNQENFVRWADKLSRPYKMECGVRQGGLTSPKLFCLYVDDLIVELSSKRIGCRIDDITINNISYADDMVLLSPTIRALNVLLRTCEVYARTHGLAYNVKKSEWLVFRAVGGKCPTTIPAIKLDGVELKRVYKFKYLGHFVTDDLKDQLDIERERRAMAVRCNMLVRRFARCTSQVKITLFKAYCQVFYTCSLWASYTQKAVSALRVQYNDGLRMLLGLPRYCSASTMFAEARVDDFFAIMRKRAASLLRRVRASPNSILSTVVGRYDSPIFRHLSLTLVKLNKSNRPVKVSLF